MELKFEIEIDYTFQVSEEINLKVSTELYRKLERILV